MKRQYISPEIEMVDMELIDILTVSGDDDYELPVIPGGGNDYELPVIPGK